MWAQLHLNISLCRVRTGDLRSADTHATTVILAPTNNRSISAAVRAKGFYRRATVRIAQANLNMRDEPNTSAGKGSTSGTGSGSGVGGKEAMKLLRLGCEDLRAALSLTPADDSVRQVSATNLIYQSPACLSLLNDDAVRQALTQCEAKLKQLHSEREREREKGKSREKRPKREKKEKSNRRAAGEY